ncbi:hypothetical protein R1sor_019942 [Riccia sorocarpa]|uniref:tRNA/rRNA methyltransferase SpoU type domain-containing protein n=1 Tax=Riccia sorocarpa TaxID=122646 RepID=A0ABD3IHK9_9MARC
MSSVEPPSNEKAVILKQLQADVPSSPLVGLLRNRLTMDSESASADVDHGATCQRDCTEIRPTMTGSVGEGRISEVRESGGNDEEKSREESPSRFESYVLVHNVAKRHNLGTIARSATAFGVMELILVGRKDFNAFGSHGASLHVQFRHFHTLPEAALYLKAKNVDICGVEIVDGAKAVHKHPFTRSTCFLLGNEGTGLSKKEMEICDFFVYIPQCGAGTASLNVTVAGSIVLHHFAVWAGFEEREREGHKFVVAERPVRRTPRNVVGDDPNEVKERRRQQKAEEGSDDWLLCDADALDENAESGITSDAEQTTASVEFPTNRNGSNRKVSSGGLFSPQNP